MLYINKHTCSRAVDFEVENGIVTSCQFIGGCDGNTKGVAALLIGRPGDDIIHVLSGIDLGGRGTSRPASPSKALSEYKASTSEQGV